MNPLSPFHEQGKLFQLYTQNELSIEDFIRANLSVRDFEKNKYGEVFTPYSYICDILNELPSTIWSNPELRWLEPASGIGNFCVVIYIHLMDGLVRVIPDQRARHEHILRNMIFMVEINEENVIRTREIFGPFANIQCADFLAQDICCADKQKQEYDVIIGNPPFQTPRDTARNSSKGGQTLWDKFILKSLELLSSKGTQTEISMFYHSAVMAKTK